MIEAKEMKQDGQVKYISGWFVQNGLRLVEMQGSEAGRIGIIDKESHITVLVDSYDEARGWLRGVGFVLEGGVKRVGGDLCLSSPSGESL